MTRKTFGRFSIIVIFLAISCFAWSAEPIRIGVPTPLTGAYVSDGLGYRQNIEFAVEEINSAGGLLGRPLKRVLFDIGDFAPELHMQAADQLISRHKVDSVHGGWSGWGQNVLAFGKYDVPTFFADASISSIEVYREDTKKYRNIYQMCDVEKPTSIAFFDGMEGLPYQYPNKKLAIIVSDDAYGREIGDGLKERAGQKGWEVPMYEVVPYGTTEWGPLLTKIRAIEPAYIHVEIVSPPDLMTFFRQFSKSPTNSLINYGYALMVPDLLKNMGAEANGIMGGVLFVMPLPAGPTPEANAWLKRFRARFGNDPLAGGYLAYLGIVMWAEAVRSVGDVTNYDAINDYIANMTYKGVEGGTWKFDKDHKIPIAPDTPLLTLQVQDGKRVTVYAGDKPYLDYKFQVPPWIK
jgi:branched-chain amino acid transport system substrate-binding protein